MASRTGMTATPLVVAIVGAESVGKSMIARALSERFGAPLVPEVARDYLAGKVGYEPRDLLEIARRQRELEERTVAHGSELVIADTDLVVVAIWWQTKYGRLSGALTNELGKGLRGDRRYLVPRPDVPWEPDPLRENPFDRDALHARYLEFLRRRELQFLEIAGVFETRLDAAIKAVGSWLSTRGS
jgi:nicotinamide riboside kinase